MKMCHVILTSCHRDVIISLVLMVVDLDKNVINIIFVRRVTVDAGYVMTVILQHLFTFKNICGQVWSITSSAHS